jgi:hypothetical protein
MYYLKSILQVWIFANNFMNWLWLEIIDKFGCDHMDLLIPYFLISVQQVPIQSWTPSYI